MGLFEKIFTKPQNKQEINQYFKTLTAYTPSFTTYEGGLYEMEITRAAIHSFATQCSKLKPELNGAASYNSLANKLKYAPNPWMDTTKFLYRLATILSIQNTAFIVPILDEFGDGITGYYPVLPTRCEVVEHNDVAYLRYTFSTGKKAVVELNRVGILTTHMYKNDFFGESNTALNPTMQLINSQVEGIREGIKQAATIRFMGRLGNTLRPEDIEKERKSFVESNLKAENNNGILIFDAKYAEIKQIESKPFIVDDKQMQQIKNNVYDYFGTNENIIQNKFTEDQWNAYYEGKIEPFAIQTSLVLTNMTFNDHQKSFGNEIILTANRLQYASNTTKLDIVTQMFDRGFMTHNQGREIFNMLPIADGDKYYIRKEYADVSNLAKTQGIGETTDDI
jgi:hypothetical protein